MIKIAYIFAIRWIQNIWLKIDFCESEWIIIMSFVWRCDSNISWSSPIFMAMNASFVFHPQKFQQVHFFDAGSGFRFEFRAVDKILRLWSQLTDRSYPVNALNQTMFIQFKQRLEIEYSVFEFKKKKPNKFNRIKIIIFLSLLFYFQIRQTEFVEQTNTQQRNK